MPGRHIVRVQIVRADRAHHHFAGVEPYTRRHRRTLIQAQLIRVTPQLLLRSQRSKHRALLEAHRVTVNTPPAKAGGFGLRLEAGLIGHSADYTTVKSSSGSGGF